VPFGAGRRDERASHRRVSAGLSNPRRRACSPTASRRRRSRWQLGSADQASVDTIELRDLAHDITNNLLTGFARPRWSRRSTRSSRPTR
jgi:hypothetical protein